MHQVYKTVETSGDLKIHESIHAGEKQFTCAKCDKTFETSDDLNRHERIHAGDKPFSCDKCEKTFTIKCI